MRVKLPFELPLIKEGAAKKKEESAQAAAMYERTLSEYRDTLENYKRCVQEYVSKLEGYDRQNMDNRLTKVQAALDMTYLKEQQDKSAGRVEDLSRQLESLSNQVSDMKTTVVNKTLASLESLSALEADTNYKADSLDKNVVNRLSELLLELQKQTLYQNRQLQAEVLTNVDKLTKTVKRNHTILWVLIAFNILSLSALIFLVLYILEIIPFPF
jgi:hypothetical protein